MHQSHEARSSISIEQLDALAARFHSSHKPSELEVQDALERGFGCLMSLEARLQRMRKQTDGNQRRGEPVTSQLLDEIESLRDALTNLRAVSRSDANSWLSQGFILPSRKRSHLP